MSEIELRLKQLETFPLWDWDKEQLIELIGELKTHIIDLSKQLLQIRDPHWKPYFFHLYWEFAPQEDFKQIIPAKPIRQHCELGNFYYHFEDKLFYYQLGGKTRKIIKRFPKGKESMANRKLYEKTPSEKGMPDIFQPVLFSEGFSSQEKSSGVSK